MLVVLVVAARVRWHVGVFRLRAEVPLRGLCSLRVTLVRLSSEDATGVPPWAAAHRNWLPGSLHCGLNWLTREQGDPALTFPIIPPGPRGGCARISEAPVRLTTQSHQAHGTCGGGGHGSPSHSRNSA